FGDWSAEGGVWQIGKPTFADGPSAAHSGNNCAGTILAGAYPAQPLDARLVSPEFIVPAATQNPRFKYWYWYDTIYISHYGQLQIRTVGGAWQDVAGERVFLKGGSWSQRVLDLRPYAGQTMQIRFDFVSDGGQVAAGWYIDDVSLETGPMVLNNPEGFEAGF